jgi:hypothetical protein
MSDNLSDFLIDLGSDPDRMARFAVDPFAALNRSSLSVEERRAVMAADSEGIRRMLHAAAAGSRNSTAQPGPPGTRNGIRKHGGKRNGAAGGGKRNGGGGRKGAKKKSGKKR